ncbi:hypothetical protein CRYUN_Cryun11dG0055100 [Craigia yunnanensis]
MVTMQEVGKRKTSSRSSRTFYVGNLLGDVCEREVEDLFYKYGPITHIDLKVPPRPPGYAFVEFEEARDAIAVVMAMILEDIAYGLNLHMGVVGVHSTLRITCVERGCLFFQVFRDGSGTIGIVDYTSYDDMKYAIKKLDDCVSECIFSGLCSG